ncbi:MAG: ABC transporter ATP-binding protein, partial [Bacteroidaceae bacterium]|nr:ABC transporter ATP-binding protein [Bacteroidaceae bacterium]
RFGSFTAVNNIDFKVKQGEIFGFLGANGAGKTTTINMLCGLLAPTSGTGRIAGMDINREYEKIKIRIGYVCQKDCLFKQFTVKENMRLIAGLYGIGKKEAPVKRDTIFG